MKWSYCILRATNATLKSSNVLNDQCEHHGISSSLGIDEESLEIVSSRSRRAAIVPILLHVLAKATARNNRLDMINTIRLVSRQSLPQFRRFHKCIVQQTESSTAAATKPVPSPPSPPPPSSDKPVDPKIDKIANDITSLNLIEVAELSDLLKKRLNLPDAPIMPVGGFVAAQPMEEEEQTQKQVQTEFTVKLMSFDEKQKVPLIKEIKSLMPDTNLVQAKKFVESAPAIVKANIAKDEAEKLQEALTKVGATVQIV